MKTNWNGVKTLKQKYLHFFFSFDFIILSPDSSLQATELREKAEEKNKPTFNPHIYTKSNAKKMEGPVAELSHKSGSVYVQRQQKARSEKQALQQRHFLWLIILIFFEVFKSSHFHCINIGLKI